MRFFINKIKGLNNNEYRKEENIRIYTQYKNRKC